MNHTTILEDSPNGFPIVHNALRVNFEKKYMGYNGISLFSKWCYIVIEWPIIGWGCHSVNIYVQASIVFSDCIDRKSSWRKCRIFLLVAEFIGDWRIYSASKKTLLSSAFSPRIFFDAITRRQLKPARKYFVGYSWRVSHLKDKSEGGSKIYESWAANAILF